MIEYWVGTDPYRSLNTGGVLRNRLNITSSVELEVAETAFVELRASAGLPNGRFSLSHYLACHKWLFSDVYTWAGKYRRVRIAKGTSVFCFPEHIDSQMRHLFAALRTGNNLSQTKRQDFVRRAAWFWSEINAIHPFREGNGRTQTLFLADLALAGGWYLDLTRLEPEPTLSAMAASFHAGTGAPLEPLVASLIRA